jgi:hypothetical protein
VKVAAPAKPSQSEPARSAAPRSAEPAPAPAAAPTIERRAEPAADLPELAVTRLRWHPEARRRTAVLQLDSREIEDAREGDIIAGIEIEEIRPDAVVVRVGGSLERIPLHP